MRVVRSERFGREFRRFYKFAIVGAIGAVVDFGTFNLLTTQIGLAGQVAQAFSFTAAIISNFMWNRFWTYPDSRSKSVTSQAVQFAVVNFVGLAIRTPIFILAEDPLTGLTQWFMDQYPNLPPISSEVLGPNLALALAVVVVLFWNFSINRIWTYSDVS
jgi:putative flippase GtrA